jgi:hypothetical protein
MKLARAIMFHSINGINATTGTSEAVVTAGKITGWNYSTGIKELYNATTAHVSGVTASDAG